MLVWNDVIFVFGIRWLEVRGNVDRFMGEMRGTGEFLEEVGVAGLGEVDVGVGGVFSHGGDLE